MEFLIGIIILFVTVVVFSIILSMMILSLFFGIPQTKKLKKEGILLPNASITKYIFTFLIQSIILFVVIYTVYIFLPKKLLTYFMIGIIYALFNSFKSLSKSNYENNIKDLLNSQRDYINPHNDIHDK